MPTEFQEHKEPDNPEVPVTLYQLYFKLSDDERAIIDSARNIVDDFLAKEDKVDIKRLKEIIKTNKGDEAFPLYKIKDRDLLKKISKLFSDEIKEKIAQRDVSGKTKETARESKPELLPEEIPVMIHRWFPDGEGWARSSLILSDEFVEIVRGSSNKLRFKKGDFKAEISDNKWLICTMRPDITTKDESAIKRNPDYLTIAVIDGPEPTGEILEEIYRQLKELPEAEKRGASENLTIGGGK